MKNRKAILFDFDNTLAITKSLKDIRDSGRYELLDDEALKPIKLIKPIAKLLETLKNQGVVLGIVTNAGKGYIDILLAHLNLSSFFDVVVTYSDVGFDGKKPSAKGIKHALDTVGIEPSQDILYVGDEYIDIVAAYRAGVKPVLAAWASKECVTTAPAIEMSTTMLENYAINPNEYKLFAEKCAELGTLDFDRKATYFLPLDKFCNVVTMKSEMEIFCLGRYFSQTSAVTANLHDQHNLSIEIAKKEQVANYEVPKYWHEMLAHVIQRAPDYLGQRFDLITVIPAKNGKNNRLENMLKGIAILMGKTKPAISFIPDLLFFSSDAVSQKHLSRQERQIESNKTLHFNDKYTKEIKDKRVLIIDDVTTTGATFIRSRDLITNRQASKVIGLVIAKTVSIIDDERICEKCGRMMWLRKNKDGVRFFSCSGYHDKDNQCTHTEDLVKKDCKYCGRPMRINIRKKDSVKFWSCTGWNQSPSCSHSEDFIEDN